MNFFAIVFGLITAPILSFGQLTTDFAVVGANAAPGPNNVGIGNNNPAFKLDLFAPGGTPGVNLVADNIQFGVGNTVLMSVNSGAFGGGNNVLTGSNYSFAFGLDNIIDNTSTSSFAAGFGNQIDFTNNGAIALGGHNRVLNNSTESAAIGEDNEINNGHGSIALGGHNVNNGGYTISIGSGLNNSISQSIMAGFGGVSTLFVDGTNNRVGIGGTTTPAQALEVGGTIRSTALAGGGNVCADANGDLYISGPCGAAAGDNLGNHNATMDLQMNCFNVQQSGDINFCTGTSLDQTSFPGELIVQGGPLGIGVAPSTVGGPMLAVAGPIWAAGTWYPSDQRFKTNINPFANPLETIMQINGYNYEYMTDAYPEYGFEEGLSNGFLAQELAEVAPNLVKTDENGMMAINYVGLIPVMTEAIKEQQTQIEARDSKITDLETQINDLQTSMAQMQTEIAEICQNGCGGSSINDSSTGNSSDSRLDPNVPNPFGGMTTIGYHIDSEATSAYISINDLNGKFITKYEVTDFGRDGQIQISADGLEAGIFLYTLVVDNQIIDAKRMIVTK